ncbi:CidA/LrgA family protein [Neobacillus niacini]|uniref:CidA/LrgA family protein n=1 Tax=Neobacillus niacini TaxID=86668 RepID=UPI002FFF1EED
MKFLNTVLQICILYIFFFIGSAIQNLFHLVIPGSIIGLILLFTCLCLKIIPVTFIERGAGFLLSILTLFFIPATVGIMKYPSLLSYHGVLLFIVILLSTVITIAIAGMTSQFFEKKAQKRKDDKKCSKPYSHSV